LAAEFTFAGIATSHCEASNQVFWWLHGKDEGPLFLEDMMEFPPCPICGEGRLLPFSDDKKPFAFWVCTKPSCGYAIGRSLTAETYYKGTATSQEKEKAGKKWTEYEF
jgi:hypothetical protein